MTTPFAFQSFSQQMRTFQSAVARGPAVAAADTLPSTKTGNDVTTTTPGGYTIKQKAGADGGEMTVTSPDGSSVHVWGDPHVSTRDGAGSAATEQFMFLNDSTLKLGDGTKITMHTVPGPNEQTLLGGATITNGDSSLETSGLTGNNTQMSRVGHGKLLDALTDDGMGINVGGASRLTLAGGAVANNANVKEMDTGNPMGHVQEMTDYINSYSAFGF